MLISSFYVKQPEKRHHFEMTLAENTLVKADQVLALIKWVFKLMLQLIFLRKSN